MAAGVSGGRALAEALAALGLDPGLGADVAIAPDEPVLGSPLAVDELACATVAAALVAAADLAEARGLGRPAVSLDAAHVAAAFRSERFARVRGMAFDPPFDPLSSFMPAADGWVRLHGNYPQHAAALRRALAVAAGAGAEEVRAAVAARTAVEVEDAVVGAGGCAAAVRADGAWPVPLGPLVAWSEGAPATSTPIRWSDCRGSALPAAGVRVVDLTRVIAGPVGTRTLAALGADVLRVDDPALPELLLAVVDGGPGKRSALLDLRTPAGREAIERLLAGADVLVQGYRPGALAAFGLDPAAVAERHPHLVTVTLSAWGDHGPWADRRGFDSLVQAASGIAVACGEGTDGAPGALPAQALDHGTGQLVAAAALRGLAERERTGRASHARLALAWTASWLLSLPRGDAGAAAGHAADMADPARYLVTLDAPFGETTLVAPPGRLDERALTWPHGPRPLGTDAPAWEDAG